MTELGRAEEAKKFLVLPILFERAAQGEKRGRVAKKLPS